MPAGILTVENNEKGYLAFGDVKSLEELVDILKPPQVATAIQYVFPNPERFLTAVWPLIAKSLYEPPSEWGMYDPLEQGVLVDENALFITSTVLFGAKELLVAWLQNGTCQQKTLAFAGIAFGLGLVPLGIDENGSLVGEGGSCPKEIALVGTDYRPA